MSNRYEAFGTEDPKINLIEHSYYINYTAISDNEITTDLAKTKTLITVE
ncbi:hypothetical protein LIT32_25980 (plasmid) [Bacillus sp. CMF21]|nr:hypothetical protein LIT32_25980 [Bacillus sp. CMF21]